MRPVELTALSNAVLMGARRYAQAAGRTYARRHLTTKQKKLLSLLVDGDGIGLEELTTSFRSEWLGILAEHPERPERANQRAFFQNIADMAGRLNAYLLAGYEAPSVRPRIVQELGGSYVGFACSYETCEVSPIGADSLEELRPQIHLIEGNEHTPRRRRSGPDHEEENSSSSATNPESAREVPEAVVPDPPPAEVSSATGSTVAEARAPASSTPPPPVEALPPPPVPTTPAARAVESTPVEPREQLEARVDPVTGRWRMKLNGRSMEVDPRLGLVALEDRILKWPHDPLPIDPEEATARQVEMLVFLTSRHDRGGNLE